MSRRSSEEATSNERNVVVKRHDITKKAPKDKRQYRVLELSNGLKVLLLSDPSAKKCGAAMHIAAGSSSDPEEVPGIAHLCEHMLFMGSEKYPIEHNFSRFIRQRDGHYNGHTYTFMTEYYFDIAPKHLEEALDRFIHMFISPLFTESALEREVQAVDSEFKDFQAFDAQRENQIVGSLTRTGVSKFICGNIDTLWNIPRAKGINVRSELIKFFEAHYCATNMSLCLVADWNMEDLEHAVLKAPLYEIPKGNAESKVQDELFYGPEELGLYLMDEGNLKPTLKRRGWTTALNTEIVVERSDFSYVNICITLTEEGVRHVEEVIKLIFSYIGTVKNYDLPTLRKYYTNFEPKHTFEVAKQYAHRLGEVPFERVAEPYDPQTLRTVLSQLTPDRMMYLVRTRENAQLEGLQKEKYYGVEYKKTKLSAELMTRFEKALATPFPSGTAERSDSGGPQKTKSEDATGADLNMAHPELLEDNDYFRMWYMGNYSQKSKLYALLTLPNILGDPLKQITAQIVVKCLLHEKRRQPQNLSVAVCSRGFELCFSYYADVCSECASFVERIVAYTPKKAVFNLVLREVVRVLKNFETKWPCEQSESLLDSILTEGSSTPMELLEAAEVITYDRFLVCLPQIWSFLHLELFACGYVIKEQVRQVGPRLSAAIGPKHRKGALPPARLALARELLIQEGGFFYEHEQRTHPNSCRDVYLQTGSSDIRDSFLLTMAVKLVAEPIFDTLRTKEQLCYYAHAYARKSNGRQGIRLVIQGGHNPTFVEERIDAFLENFLGHVRSMSDEDFERCRAACRVSPKCELALHCWNEIKNRRCRFDLDLWKTESKNQLRWITKKDLVEFYEKRIAPGSAERRKLSIRVLSVPEANGSEGERSELARKRVFSVHALKKSLYSLRFSEYQ
ncbi:hypothetical protein QR680_008758 [Steinernema hermaphroditum]|uniref:Peptidase M16 N-terminal domain-containing protein n=1 Tax=Steinernema hermaphroditum TaxID=289476 RepID=A0AA39IHT9_9BILA|nr:hypothetical protein QR680_008758 [Steinernema hermaphroditum]